MLVGVIRPSTLGSYASSLTADQDEFRRLRSSSDGVAPMGKILTILTGGLPDRFGGSSVTRITKSLFCNSLGIRVTCDFRLCPTPPGGEIGTTIVTTVPPSVAPTLRRRNLRRVDWSRNVAAAATIASTPSAAAEHLVQQWNHALPLTSAILCATMLRTHCSIEILGGSTGAWRQETCGTSKTASSSCAASAMPRGPRASPGRRRNWS